ncbi:inositol-3-phosphate synthase [Bifidobacterium aquikefiricola]|uniref:Inositol-3-phosphate synthase n=1 Tax=Bifidobacterium aquikefiricola TaxID=3059038 RepID=A0AB39U7Q0_9BIFI
MSIRVAIAGVGNCASSLVQGVSFYKDVDDDEHVPGLMHTVFGGYRVRDIEFVAAFDVDAAKVGLDLSKAIYASQNNTYKFEDVPDLGVEVQRGPTGDGLGEYYQQMIKESDAEPVDVASVLRERHVDILVSYLPVGSEEADKGYAQAAMDAGCAFVNCLPVFIASDPEWAQKFKDAGVPIVGDDIKSQVGATITHRVMARLFEDRGVRLDRTYQLNVGGNMDFMNMLQRTRLESKKISKTRAVTSIVPHDMEDRNVHIGPSDYVAWLDDRKLAFVRLEGTTFGNVPLELEYKLTVWDSPNSAGIVIDAIRAAKIALDRGLAGPILAPSSYFMKSPAVQHEDNEARRLVEEFIAGSVESTQDTLDADAAAAKAAGKDVWNA